MRSITIGLIDMIDSICDKMKTSVFFVVLLIVFLSSPDHAQAQAGSAVQTIVKVLTGLGAAESMRRSGQSYEQFKDEDAILTKLRSQGLDANKSSIYSIYFSTSGGVWADFWTRPDLFFVVDIEGQSSQLVPQIRYNYRGEPVLDVLFADTVRPGSRVVVRILDDDTSSDAIWNSILKTRAHLSVTPEVNATKFVSLQANASGQLTLLDDTVIIDAPDFIAAASFAVPETKDGRWVADAKLVDSTRKEVGTLQFASLWSAPQELLEQQQKVSTSFGKFIFWGVIGICLLVWFGWSVFSNPQDQSPPA